MMTNNTAIFRCDASAQIGAGHVMRCLTLANHLQDYAVTFLCLECPDNIKNQIKAQGHKVVLVESESNALNVIARTQPDLLIIDHYGLDKQFEYQATPFCGHLIVIDDVAYRQHLCDILIDQNPHVDKSIYDDLIPDAAQKLIGVQYALLRPEFRDIRQKTVIRQGVKNILVFLSGGDSMNMTSISLKGIEEFNEITINVVVGGMNPHKNSIKLMCEKHPNWNYFEDISNMAEMMAQADLCLGASGSTSMERACLGLPSIVTLLADNQKVIAQPFADLGVHVNLGYYNQLTPADWRDAVKDFVKTPEKLKTMSQTAFECVDGQGTERVLGIINTLHNVPKTTYLRPIIDNDKYTILKWRNSDHVRQYMHKADIISLENHEKWFEKILNNPNQYDYQIFVLDNQDVGVMGFYNFDESQTCCEWGFYLGVKNLPKNTGKIMGRMALNYAFTTYCELNTIKAEAYKKNPRSIQFHIDLGFEKIKEDDVTLYFTFNI